MDKIDTSSGNQTLMNTLDAPIHRRIYPKLSLHKIGVTGLFVCEVRVILFADAGQKLPGGFKEACPSLPSIGITSADVGHERFVPLTAHITNFGELSIGYDLFTPAPEDGLAFVDYDHRGLKHMLSAVQSIIPEKLRF